METNSKTGSSSAICSTDQSKSSRHRGTKRRHSRSDSVSRDRRRERNRRRRARTTERRREYRLRHGCGQDKSSSRPGPIQQDRSPSKRRKTRRAKNAHSHAGKAERNALFLEQKREENEAASRRAAIKRRRERSASVPPTPKRHRTSDQLNYTMGRARRSVQRAVVIAKKRDTIRVEKDRQIERDAHLADVALMRRMMATNPYTAVRDPRVSALAGRLGGATEWDYLHVRAQWEAAPWAVYIDPASRSALHRLCAMESGDN